MLVKSGQASVCARCEDKNTQACIQYQRRFSTESLGCSARRQNRPSVDSFLQDGAPWWRRRRDGQCEASKQAQDGIAETVDSAMDVPSSTILLACLPLPYSMEEE